jgi:hypothetical protein
MRLVVLGLALFALGCPDRSIAPVVPVESGAYIKDIPVSSDIDLLFVIDNSASTRDKQTIFASNFANFVTALQNFPGGFPNVHIGVVASTVDVGVDSFGPACHPVTSQNGVLQARSLDPTVTCTPGTAERFLVDVARADGTRTRNYTGALSDALSCISQVGEGGCGFEAPLEAMKRALDGSHGENAGFVRPGAFLAVVILTDEDDCSGTPALFTQSTQVVGKDDFRCVQPAYQCDTAISPSAPGMYSHCNVRRDGLLADPGDYAQFLSALKGPSRVAVAVIAGDPTTSIATGPLTITSGPSSTPVSEALALQPSCSVMINSTLAIGRPALRLADFLGNFGDRGLFRTVCQSSYTQALDDIGALLFRAVSPCLEGQIDLRDTDTGNPGLQPDCKVSELQDPDTDAQVETLLPPCRMIAADQPDPAGARACWWVRSNPAACSTETHLEVHVERTALPPPNTTVRVACAIVDS